MPPRSSQQSTLQLYPLTFDPAFKDYPWGGRNLETVLGRDLPDGIVAESWDISGHPNGPSIVNNGPLRGKSLPQLQEMLGEALVGTHSKQALDLERFPLLIKLLDANRWLSIQVHPDDEYGLAHEDEFGKTEMWVVLHAEPDAEIIYGFQPSMTAARYAAEIGTEASADGLYRLPVQPGDVIFVPSGTIHALGPGIIVAEIQQNSDTTYRIYDWGRPRPLHLRQALDVLNFDLVEPQAIAPNVLVDEDSFKAEQLVSCKYFETERLFMSPGDTFYGLCDGDTFEIWGVMQGRTTITGNETTVTISAVNWALLPAEMGEFHVEAEAESMLLRVFVPEPPEEG